MATKKSGRPAVIVDPVQVEKLASRWMTREAIADFLGISRETLRYKMNADPQLDAAWHKGRASLQMKSMDWLIASASNGNVRAQTFLAERICGLNERVTHEGEVTARYVVELPAEVPLPNWQQTFRPRDPGENDPGSVH
jgi:hypothetical protein